MFQKTVERERPYSKEEIKKIRKAFKELEKFRDSSSVQAYTKKLLKELKG